MIIENFTPLSALIGGLLIGAGAMLMILLNGRIAGVSGILGSVVTSNPVSWGRENAWRLAFLVGLILGAQLATLIVPVPVRIDAGWPVLLIGGLLVGFGTRLGSGCTSGHGVCGVSRLSPRSLVATTVFVLTAMVTLYIARHIVGVVP